MPDANTIADLYRQIYQYDGWAPRSPTQDDLDRRGLAKMYVVTPEFTETVTEVSLRCSESPDPQMPITGIERVLQHDFGLSVIKLASGTYRADGTLSDAYSDFEIYLSRLLGNSASDVALSLDFAWALSADRTSLTLCFEDKEGDPVDIPVRFGFEGTGRILKLASSCSTNQCAMVIENVGLVLCEAFLVGGSAQPEVEKTTWTVVNGIDWKDVVDIALTPDVILYVTVQGVAGRIRMGTRAPSSANSGHRNSADDSAELPPLQALDIKPHEIYEDAKSGKSPNTRFKKVCVSNQNHIALVGDDGSCVLIYRWSKETKDFTQVSKCYNVRHVAFGNENTYLLTEGGKIYYKAYTSDQWSKLVFLDKFRNMKVFQMLSETDYGGEDHLLFVGSVSADDDPAASEVVTDRVEEYHTALPTEIAANGSVPETAHVDSLGH